ncbi:NUDIX hydrolase [Bacillus sp. M6-12]|uniref:NUDIX hydrolase n=1 Tax=Bacillus sp. M6-12 TaxID=2054166 RepID=UPI000C7791CD|nr:NUDIX domain-containing protein [Bacillus sp. M6-12]PLS16104.1 NUDIX hydrolase [Bacillus sp. M6-12]
MNDEMLKIFDENHIQAGTASRKEVHNLGYWHETFHCWFISREENKDYVYFQLRSKEKKDFPGLFDITAAGHILSHESVADGIREVHEELGIDVSMDELEYLGVIKDANTTEHFIDNELAHVFLYRTEGLNSQFSFQKEEVSGIARAELNSFFALCKGKADEIRMDGFEIDQNSNKIPFSKMVSKSGIVPHEESYLLKVATAIQTALNKSKG